MESITRSFGQVIREQRRKLGLTQEDTARRISTSMTYISHLEAGKRHPSEKVVLKMAAALSLEAREMFFLANPRTKIIIAEKQKLTLGSNTAMRRFKARPET